MFVGTFATHLSRVSCEARPNCHSRILYMSDSRTRLMVDLHNELMRKMGVSVLDTYSLSYQHSELTLPGDGRHYEHELYHKIWDSWWKRGQNVVTEWDQPCS